MTGKPPPGRVGPVPPSGWAPAQPPPFGWAGPPPPPGWPADPRQVAARTPSGLFPSRPVPHPSRPVYREPHPVRPVGVASGVAAGGVWLLGFGLLATDLHGYLWWTLLAGLVAWLVAAVLVRWGDRGVAAGVSMITAAGWSMAGLALVVKWTGTGDWPMW